MKFKFYRQLDKVDCGPTCLKMVAEFYGQNLSIEYLRNRTFVNREGVSLLSLRDAAEGLGFKTLAAELPLSNLLKSPHPCILHWNTNHFVVLVKVEQAKSLFNSTKGHLFHIADPGSNAIVKVDERTFLKCWATKNEEKGFALFLVPEEKFFSLSEEDQVDQNKGFNVGRFLLTHFLRFKPFFIYVFLAVVAASLISLALPLITQGMVDTGIGNKDVYFITLMLLCQVALFIASTITSVIQSHILLHISSRINISLVSEFLAKLMRMPVRFFESKMIGDIIQRIEDHHRIDTFLTTTFLDIFLSLVNLIIFSLVLGLYDSQILIIFAIGSTLAVLWTFFFNSRKRSLDYRNFQQLAHNTENLHEIVRGMQEIKINNFEKYKRWEWSNSQIKLFNVRIQNLTVTQYQEIGANFITQLKNLVITFVAAYGVVNSEITFGMMMSIAYMTGQLNVPVERIKAFFISLQGVRFSLERIKEVYVKDDEEREEDLRLSRESLLDPHQVESQVTSNINTGGILINEVDFQYEGPKSPRVLKNVSLFIPLNKVTAIVGTSGSGKTTLLKMLLKFYEPAKGTIKINGIDLNNISAESLRKNCGVVMQDGFIFSDTIYKNIAMVDDTEVDSARLHEAARIANIQEFIDALPLGFKTKIGEAGVGISAGQKQRILIARAVYKNPAFLFFDEATSALDANNEKIIINNLNEFFKNRTVVIIAHRLSTVKNADQLIVLENGSVAEVGSHQLLVSQQGHYYNLIKNQLELGS